MSALTALVLAGGAGQRMGGEDKGLIALNGQPLVAHVLARIADQADEVLISANRNTECYAAFGYPIIADQISEADGSRAGPLAGLHAGLLAARHALVLCVPCDTPYLPRDLAPGLLAALQAAPAGTPLVCARAAGRTHHTVCLLRRDLAPSLASFLARGERRVGLWQTEIGAIAADFPDPMAFRNLNSPDDLAGLRTPSAQPAHDGAALHSDVTS